MLSRASRRVATDPSGWRIDHGERQEFCSHDLEASSRPFRRVLSAECSGAERSRGVSSYGSAWPNARGMVGVRVMQLDDQRGKEKRTTVSYTSVSFVHQCEYRYP